MLKKTIKKTFENKYGILKIRGDILEDKHKVGNPKISGIRECTEDKGYLLL
jgi:hypothetical protein